MRRVFNWLQERRMWSRLRRGYCPWCNLDAPAIDTCPVCLTFRGSFPPMLHVRAAWLERYEYEMAIRDAVRALREEEEM